MFLSLALTFGKSLLTSEIAKYLVTQGITKAEDFTHAHQQALLATLKAKLPWLVTAQVETAVLALEEGVFSVVSAAVDHVGGTEAAQNQVQNVINRVLAVASDAHSAASAVAKAS